jgi:branched-chain amino acid transport system ATP-binding protein
LAAASTEPQPNEPRADEPRLLALSEVSAGYGSFQALFDVSLSVGSGEAVGVIGPNGAGKTTLMRVISGLLPATAGEVRLLDQSIAHLPASRIVAEGIAHVPENRRLFSRLTVEENLRMGAYIPAARRHLAERLHWVYELFPRLRERRGQLAGTMSGGEQQMCAIGRALMSQPKLLLMDEPSAGLAPLAVEQVFELVRRIRTEGFTVLIVEQNVQQVLALVDRAYLLEAGHIKLSGSASELRANDAIRKAYMGI